MGDFKLLSRRVVDTLLRLPENDPYLRGIIRWVGFRQDSIPYQRLPRHSGRTHFPLLSAAPVQEFIRGVTSFSVAPLLLCLIYGAVISLISLSYIGVIVVTKLMGINPPGFSAIMAATLFLNGNVLLTNGLIGLYIARIYNQVKDRPRYIIQGTVGLDDKDP
jgi:dolichol-phosphate mannosyltransferase